MKGNWLSWSIAAAMALLILAGCGSTRKTDGIITGTEISGEALNAATVGLNVCTNCHSGQTTQWLKGAHGNYESIDARHQKIDNGMQNDGFPYYGYFSDSSCSSCHDQLGDGQRLTAEWTGSVPRPVVGCESCHGGGQYHNGIGPLPYATPGAVQCGQCHNESFNHNLYHPEADHIVEDYLSSPHAASINDHNYVAGTEDVQARCSKCHTDEGAKLYKDVQGDSATIQALDANPAVTGATPVQCRTCHNAHSPKDLLFSDSATESAEFRTCTNCHQKETAYHDPATNLYGSAGEIITDTHFDNGTGTGYNINPAAPRACRNCHNVHAADTTINKQWAASGHADLKAKAFNIYLPGILDKDMQRDKECQECHSATAAIMRFDAYEKGGTYTAPGDKISGPAREVVYCTVCHKDNAGGLRIPGQITAHYLAAGSDKPAQFDDVKGSNLCIGCHSGKRSGQDIKDEIYLITDRVTSHYLPAGGVLFGKIGYHFDHLKSDLVYTSTYHARIGDKDYNWADYSYGKMSATQVAAIQGSGNGPCVACHMAAGTEKHLYSVFTDKTPLGLPDLCYNCHSSDPASPYFKSKEKLEEEGKAGYDATLAYIKSMMENGAKNYTEGVLSGENTGLFLRNGVPLNPASAADKDLAGALFNYKLFKDEHAGYVHNRYYAKQLLFDSIDYLEDGVVDGSVTVTDEVAAAWLDKDPAAAGVQRR